MSGVEYVLDDCVGHLRALKEGMMFTVEILR